jgi:hypothetical protein
MLTMRGTDDRTSQGSANRISRTALIRVAWCARSPSSSVISSNPPTLGLGTLVTRMSRPPNVSIATARSRSTSALEETSAARKPRAPVSRAALARRSGVRAQIKTSAPSSARAAAQAFPIPLLAAVTSARRPLR